MAAYHRHNQFFFQLRRRAPSLAKLGVGVIAITLIARNVNWHDVAQVHDGTTGYVVSRTHQQLRIRSAAAAEIRTIDLQQITAIEPGLRTLLMSVHPRQWGLFIVAPAVAHGLFWCRWHSLLRWNGAQLDWVWTGGVWIKSQIAGLLPVGSMGADAYRVLALRTACSGTAVPLGIVAIERFTGLVALVAIGAAGLTVAQDRIEQLPQVGSALVVTALGLAGLMAGLWWMDHGRMQQGNRPTTRWVWLSSAMLPLNHIRHAPRRLLAVLCLSLFAQSASVLSYVVIDRSMGWDSPVACYLVALPMVTMAQVLPFHIAGLGVAELGLWFFLSRWTFRTATDAILMASLARFSTWAAFAGWGLFLAGVGLMRRWHGTRTLVAPLTHAQVGPTPSDWVVNARRTT